MQTFDAALRRQLRKEMGSRTSRRVGTNARGAVKPRQVLAQKIEEWAQKRAAEQLAK